MQYIFVCLGFILAYVSYRLIQILKRQQQILLKIILCILIVISIFYSILLIKIGFEWIIYGLKD